MQGFPIEFEGTSTLFPATCKVQSTGFTIVSWTLLIPWHAIAVTVTVNIATAAIVGMAHATNLTGTVAVSVGHYRLIWHGMGMAEAVAVWWLWQMVVTMAGIGVVIVIAAIWGRDVVVILTTVALHSVFSLKIVRTVRARLDFSSTLFNEDNVTFFNSTQKPPYPIYNMRRPNRVTLGMLIHAIGPILVMSNRMLWWPVVLRFRRWHWFVSPRWFTLRWQRRYWFVITCSATINKRKRLAQGFRSSKGGRWLVLWKGSLN